MFAGADGPQFLSERISAYRYYLYSRYVNFTEKPPDATLSAGHVALSQDRLLSFRIPIALGA